MSKLYTIAIDGPAGAGKSTVAKGVAQALGYKYIDTGAMYRAITYLALKEEIDLSNAEALSKLASSVKIEMTTHNNQILIDGEDVTVPIREPLVTRHVSQVSNVSGVRTHLIDLQRLVATAGGVVMEGRDIGTVVLPAADFKFYITASPYVRACRRAKDLELLGYKVDLTDLMKEIETRDFLDSTRSINPLKAADDAVIIDCTDMDAQEVIYLILNKVSKE